VVTVVRAWDWGEATQRCRAAALRVSRDRTAFDDLAQEAVLRAWRASERGVVPDAPDAWLARIARNEASRWASRAWHQREESVAEPAAADAVLAVPDAADHLIDRITVREVIGRLPACDRELLHLRYDRDLTQREIAERLDLPEGTVKVRLHRVRRRLARELQ
jgi:RNA polymerase sigma-70 factor, ECF subfamily